MVTFVIIVLAFLVIKKLRDDAKYAVKHGLVSDVKPHKFRGNNGFFDYNHQPITLDISVLKDD